MTGGPMRQAFERLRNEATVLAGGLMTDLAQRATVYHHLFQHSGGNHAFPLIAAHGALWARGYFAGRLAVGRLLAWQFAFQPEKRRRQLAALDAFADVFRDVNRRVCIDTYTNYHFTARFGNHAGAGEFVPATLLAALNRLHAARAAGIELPDDEKRQIFTSHFLNEQHNVVGPALADAVAGFRWPLVKFLALRPRIQFAYFPARHSLQFHNFADTDERITHGLGAFDLAASAGWPAVVNALANYAVLPGSFFTDNERHFSRMREAVLQLCAPLSPA